MKNQTVLKTAHSSAGRYRLNRPPRCRAGAARRRGSVVVLSALGITALCGFCALSTDYGRMVWTKNQLQRACDAAALGGASQLPNGLNAQYTAQIVAGQNALNDPVISWPNGVKQIRVSGSRTVNFGFARVIGLSSGTVTARATAGRLGISGALSTAPLAITTIDYYAHRTLGEPFEVTLVDNNRQNFGAGNVVGLDLRPGDNGKSGAVFQDDLASGYQGPTTIGESFNALNASLSSQGPKLEDGLETRFENATRAPYNDTGSNYTFPNYPANTPRIAYIVVADPQSADNNNPMITARLIVPVYLEEVNGDKKSRAFGVRLRIMPPRLFNTDDPTIIVGDDNTPDSGMSVIKMLD